MSRSIRLDIEVPGTPEEVWQLIATGHGITSWFVPAQVEERLGGAVTLDFGLENPEPGRITVWEPPHRFVYEGAEQGERRLAYEWLVEAREGGTCVVRLINSGFLSGAEWDAEFDGMSDGWPVFLDNLRLARTHFPGQRCVSINVNGMTAGPSGTAWKTLAQTLGLRDAYAVGDRLQVTAADAPPLAGTVAAIHGHVLNLVLDSPTPAIGVLGVEGKTDVAVLSVYVYAFGPTAPEVVIGDAPRWKSWLASHFQAWTA